VGSDAWRTFRIPIILQDHQDISFSLIVVSGRADMYVRSDTFPNETNKYDLWTFRTEWYSAAQVIRIGDTNPHRCSQPQAGGTVCVYYIGIHGVNDCDFTIVAGTGGSVVQLQDGIPWPESISKDQFAFYSFYLRTPNQALTFSLTPITGDPDLWLAQPNADGSNPYTHPTNASTSTNTSRSFGGDVLVFENARTGFYYMGVQAYGGNVSFSIMAITEDMNAPDTASLTLLPEGLSQVGLVRKGHYKYYLYQLSQAAGHSKLTITVDRTYGDPDLYVHRSDTADNVMPTNTSSDWRSNSYRGDVVVIDMPAAGFYYIGVHGFTAAQFTIKAVSDAVITPLSSGQQFSGQMIRHEKAQFVYEVINLDQDITIAVDTITGDADVYVSRTVQKPTLQNSTWYVGMHSIFHTACV